MRIPPTAPRVWIVAIAFGLLAACASSAAGEVQFPIIGNDPDGLVDTMEWGESTGALPASADFAEPLVLEASSPEIVQVGVQGGGCPPSARVLVTGTPDSVTVAMQLGGTIEPIGVECADVPTAHILVIRFKTPIDLEGLTVTATLSGE